MSKDYQYQFILQLIGVYPEYVKGFAAAVSRFQVISGPFFSTKSSRTTQRILGKVYLEVTWSYQ